MRIPGKESDLAGGDAELGPSTPGLRGLCRGGGIAGRHVLGASSKVEINRSSSGVQDDLSGRRRTVSELPRSDRDSLQAPLRNERGALEEDVVFGVRHGASHPAAVQG
jgi:hypothetical protein